VRKRTHPQQEAPKRINRGYAIREDIIIKYRVAAARSGRKLYELMEEALSAYLPQLESEE
jgi:hypothetical protein